MNTKLLSIAAGLSLLAQSPSVFAQAVQAAAAPAAAPNAATATNPTQATAVAQPQATSPQGTANGDAQVLATRDAPSARNQVAEAFVPQSGGLTANDVAKRATASSHVIAAKNAELRAAAAKVDSAMYQFLPRVTLKASYTRVNPVKVSLGGSGYSLGAAGPGPYGMSERAINPLTREPVEGNVLAALGDPENPTEHPDIAVIGGKMNFPVVTNYYSLSASLGVPLSDYVLRMSNSIDGTKHNREAAELNIKAEHQKVEGDARVAFFNWARAIGQVAVTEKSIDRVKARLKDAEAGFTVGLVTKAEVLRLQALVAATEAGLESARGFRELAAQQLSVIMNDRQANYTLGEDVLAQPAQRPIEPLERLVAEAMQRRLELQALSHTVQSLDKAESVVRAGELPRLDGFADFTYANPNQRHMFTKDWRHTWSAGVQLSWTINDVLTNRSSGEELHANRETVEANRRALAQAIRMEVTAAYTDGLRAAAELEAAKRSAEASQAAYDTSIQLYRVGKATTAELIDSEAELVNSNLRLINAHIDTKVAETKLTRSIGRDLTKVRN